MALAHNLRTLLQASRPQDPVTRMAFEAYIAAIEAYALALLPDEVRMEACDEWRDILTELSQHLRAARAKVSETQPTTPVLCTCDLPSFMLKGDDSTGFWNDELAVDARVTCRLGHGMPCARHETDEHDSSFWQFDHAEQVMLCQSSSMTSAAIAQATEIANVVLTIDGGLDESHTSHRISGTFL